MSRIEDEVFTVECPNPKCGRDINTKIRDAASSRRIRCQRCGTEIAVDSNAAGKLQRAARDFEKAQEALAQSQARILDKAQIKLR